MGGPHFVRANWTEKCGECDAVIRQNELMMPVYVRDPKHVGTRRTRVVYCEDCGKLYLESQER